MSAGLTLPQRLIALDDLLEAAEIPHAFGGAIALAYWTRDPRGTSDIDVNLFIDAAGSEPALRALPPAVEWNSDAVTTIRDEGQIRLWWDETPLDLFFDYAPVHRRAAQHARLVPFEGTQIPILGPVELAVFKALFDRTRDWADLEAMAGAGTLDSEAVREVLLEMLDPDDARLARLDAITRA
jgi:hypothetical protein